jgi:hypothetical protein
MASRQNSRKSEATCILSTISWFTVPIIEFTYLYTIDAWKLLCLSPVGFYLHVFPQMSYLQRSVTRWITVTLAYLRLHFKINAAILLERVQILPHSWRNLEKFVSSPHKFFHLIKCYHKILQILFPPVSVAERSKACTAFARPEAGIVRSNTTQSMDVWHVYVFILCLCCSVFR